MKTITLCCANDDLVDHPTLDMVLRELELIEHDQGLHLSPELLLHSKTDGLETHRLCFTLLVEETSGMNVGWAVSHQFEDTRPSVDLFQQLPSIPPVYRTCLECGCPMEIRVESILTKKALLSQAVSWYLSEGTANPELLWLPEGESRNLLSHAEWNLREAAKRKASN